jgi:TetR/AcrR family transcriptional regulator, transcriptional repressor for nem operon
MAVSKAEYTKQKIIEQAAIIFNRNGYAGTSIADIMRLTGLPRASIHHHFRTKDEIAIAAFDHTLTSIVEAVMQNVEQQETAIDRLGAFVDTFRGFTTQPIGVGGCPILNTAVESDDTHPALRQHAQRAVSQIRALVGSIVELGIRQGEIVVTTDIEQVSTVILATIEGAIMISKLYGNDLYLDQAIAHLHQYINDLHSPTKLIKSQV